MNKKLFKTITLIKLIIGSNLMSDTQIFKDYQAIVNSFKFKDTSNKELSQIYKINGSGEIEVEFGKERSNHLYYVRPIIRQYKPYKTSLDEPKYWLSISKYDNKMLGVACIKSDNTIIIAATTRYSTFRNKEKKIGYTGFVANIKQNNNGSLNGTSEFSNRYLIDSPIGNDNIDRPAFTSIPTYNPKQFYPYYNEEKILARLYETGTCDKEATEKANIQVLINGKWIPQKSIGK